MRLLIICASMAGCLLSTGSAFARDSSRPPCQVQSVEFDGWQAEQISNAWVRLTIVPQLGGRLMQARFADHDYLFVNPEYKGKYFPPSEGAEKGKWFNYGGDKIWPMPEGSNDEQHWPGPLADLLDDGAYKLTVLSQDPTCAVRLEGPADPKTGLQYSRKITVRRDSPEISFHASMKNIVGHAIEWSMQSVSQYDTSGHPNGAYNHDFWAFAPVNGQSAYFNQFQVRDGLADDPSFEVNDGLFKLHWLFLENEVWLDSNAGWLAVVDDSSHYAMVERFQYEKDAEYPGKATLIFYKNGAALELDQDGMPALRSSKPQDTPYYMEAEINSPIVRLQPGDSYSMDTRWFPTRAASQLKTVTDVAVINKPLAASLDANSLLLSGSFGVFFPGELIVHGFNPRGIETDAVPLLRVDPANSVELQQQVRLSPNAVRISVHLVDDAGVDRGTVGEALISKTEKSS